MSYYPYYSMGYQNYYQWPMSQYSPMSQYPTMSAYSMPSQYTMPNQYYMPSPYYGYGQQPGYGSPYPYGGQSYGYAQQPTPFYQYRNPMGCSPFGLFEQSANPYYSMMSMGLPMGFGNPYRQFPMLPSY